MSKKEMYVSVLDIKFYVSDEDGNEILNKDGTIKEFYFDGRLKPLEYLCEDITVEDLKEIKEEASTYFILMIALLHQQKHSLIRC